MKMKSLIAVAGVAMLFCLGASANDFQPIGYESTAMGGAGVASATGSMMGYYNPALLARARGMEIGVTAGIGLDDKNMADKIRILNDLQLVNTLKTMNAEVTAQGGSFNGFSAGVKTNIDQAIDLVIDAKNNGSSLKMQPNGGVGVQMGTFAVGVFGYGDETATAFIPSGTDLTFKTAINVGGTNYDIIFLYNKTANTVSYNTFSPGTTTPVLPPTAGLAATYNPSISAVGYGTNSLYEGVVVQKTDVIQISGNAVTEIPISLATSVKLPLLGSISIGASVKPMMGYTYSHTVDIDTKFQDVVDSFKDNETKSTALGIDVGAALDLPGINMITIGIVGKNINHPEFTDNTSAAQFKLDPLYRCGAAINITKGIKIAADYDLSANKDANGNASRYLGGGISLDGGFFKLRGGAMQNIGLAGSDLLYTAGLSMGVKYINLNVAAVWDSNNTTTYDGKSYPNPTKVSVGLASRW